MHWRALTACALAMLLTACKFFSNAPLFDEHEAVTPFISGAHFEWREGNAEETHVVVYRRVGTSYELRGDDNAEAPLRLFFVPIQETPEEDYIAQIMLPPQGEGDEGRVYAFLWRTSSGFRIVSSPFATRDVENLAQSNCIEEAYSQCRFATSDNLINYYREAIYPSFVVGKAIPADYMEQTPIALAR